MKKPGYLHNIYDRETLQARYAADSGSRRTLSFYRYVKIPVPGDLKDRLYEDWFDLGVLGRIYLAEEGINAQISVPLEREEAFLRSLEDYFPAMPLKIALEEKAPSFLKLIIKVRSKIVADGLDDATFDPADTGRHLSAREFNEAMDQEGTIVVDMRNHYESEVGHFEGAICPDVDTFREELPLVRDMLKDDQNKKILLYCTGGIRCEKASAWLKHQGFQDVNQLRGGIIDYVRQVREENLPGRFHGKNFVFDDRLGERVTDEVISQCHQCGVSCDDHTNCANDACHLLFIQCPACREKWSGCCTPECQEVISMPVEKQREYRRSLPRPLDIYRSRLRPRLRPPVEKGLTPGPAPFSPGKRG